MTCPAAVSAPGGAEQADAALQREQQRPVIRVLAGVEAEQVQEKRAEHDRDGQGKQRPAGAQPVAGDQPVEPQDRALRQRRAVAAHLHLAVVEVGRSGSSFLSSRPLRSSR